MWNHPFGRWIPEVEPSSSMSPPSKADETCTGPGSGDAKGMGQTEDQGTERTGRVD